MQDDLTTERWTTAHWLSGLLIAVGYYDDWRDALRWWCWPAYEAWQWLTT